MREKWIDNAKGIAILLVIIGHVSGGLTGIMKFNWVYGVHLVMFFVLSGYTFKKRSFTAEYVNGKFLRLMKPYFYTCIAILVTDVFNVCVILGDGSIATISGVIALDLVRSFFASGSITTFGNIELGTRIGAIWFLPAMFFALIMFQMLLNYINDDRKLGLSVTVIALLGYITARFIWFPFSIQSGMMALFFIWIGYELKKYSVLQKIKGYHYAIAQIIFLFGIRYGFCMVDFATANVNDIFLSPIVGLSGCLLIYLISKLNVNGRILAYIGQISLSILCVHLYALEVTGWYFEKILVRSGLKGDARIWLLIMLEIVFAVVIAIIITHVKNVWNRCSEFLKGKVQDLLGYAEDNRSIDITNGILIILILIGDFAIDGRLRMIIYSCHIIAFVLLSGYLYGINSLQLIKKLVRFFLIPYGVLVLCFVITNYKIWNSSFLIKTAMKYLVGNSFSGNLSTGDSVGPIWFVLMLILVHLIYMAITQWIETPLLKTALILVIWGIGIVLGKIGCWLPWSADVAFYCLIFFHIGYLCKRYDVLNMVSTIHGLYFLLVPVWAYMIYTSGMELAIRNYGHYGLTILGATAGTLMIYMLAAYIGDNLLFVRAILRLAGKNAMIVLIIHTLYDGKIADFVSKRFDVDHVPSMICRITIQLVVAIGIGGILVIIKKFSNRKILKC